MPKSKRFKKISLTRTKKKGLPSKQRLVEEIRENVEKYERIFLFTITNMRSNSLKEVRNHWKGNSRFFFGKSKVMALALGRTKESEAADNLHKLAKYIKGQCGLFFTNEKKDKVIEWFDNYIQPEFARSGFKVDRTVTLPQGPLEGFVSSMEPDLRKLGLPTELKKGVILLRSEHVVCKEGQILTPNQAQILKLIGECLAEFRVTFKSVWDKSGEFEVLDKENGIDDGNEDDDDNEDEDEEMDE